MENYVYGAIKIDITLPTNENYTNLIDYIIALHLNIIPQ